MQANRAVVFTTLNKLGDIKEMQNVRRIEEAITGAYLEGDVRLNLTPADAAPGEQRLEANRVYYDFTTDRARGLLIYADAQPHTTQRVTLPASGAHIDIDAIGIDLSTRWRTVLGQARDAAKALEAIADHA